LTSVENSPLELYETAYRLHHNEDRPSEALKYYDALIREFPDSNECAYAVIQINRIKANDVAASITVKRKGGVLGVMAFILCLLILAALGAGAYLAWEYVLPEAQNAQQRNILATQALGKILDGKNEEALMLLDDMKLLSDTDITPYELSSQIYRRGGLIDQARAEYEAFFTKNPSMRTRPVEEIVPDPEPLPAKKKR